MYLYTKKKFLYDISYQFIKINLKVFLIINRIEIVSLNLLKYY